MNNLDPSTVGNLIPVFTAEIGGISTLAVNARELHQFLGAKRDFSNWIKRRITENKFVEGEDFTITIPNFGDGYKRKWLCCGSSDFGVIT
jgi:anti-repressor protein